MWIRKVAVASDVDMTPGAELREGHQSTGAQPFTSEVLLEANTDFLLVETDLAAAFQRASREDMLAELRTR